jgi:hypothetical protein
MNCGGLFNIEHAARFVRVRGYWHPPGQLNSNQGCTVVWGLSQHTVALRGDGPTLSQYMPIHLFFAGFLARSAARRLSARFATAASYAFLARAERCTAVIVCRLRLPPILPLAANLAHDFTSGELSRIPATFRCSRSTPIPATFLVEPERRVLPIGIDQRSGHRPGCEKRRIERKDGLIALLSPKSARRAGADDVLSSTV